MGTIFVEPTRQVAELGRLLKAGGVLAFSSWVHDTANPFFSPILNVLGAPRRPATRPINGVTRARSRRDCRPTSTTSRSNPPFTLGNSRRWTRQCASSRMSHQCTYRCSATSTKRSTTAGDRVRDRDAGTCRRRRPRLVRLPLRGRDRPETVTTTAALACSGSGLAGSISSGPLLRTLLTSRDTSRISMRSRSPCPRSRPSSMGTSGSSQRSQSSRLMVSGIRS